MRRSFSVVVAAGFVCTLPAWAGQDQPSVVAPEALEKACLKAACRRDVQVEIRRDDGSVFKKTFALLPPAVQPFGVSVLAGQTIHIEAEVDGNRLTQLTAVDKVTAPAKTMTASLEQVDGKGMMLVVTNPFAKTLKFNMGMMGLGSDRLLKTSSCPIVPGGKIYEMWPYPLFQIVLSNARLLEPDANPGCVN
jgi:hypothetical protein